VSTADSGSYSVAIVAPARIKRIYRLAATIGAFTGSHRRHGRDPAPVDDGGCVAAAPVAPTLEQSSAFALGVELAKYPYCLSGTGGHSRAPADAFAL